jgi:hypothetical protein
MQPRLEEAVANTPQIAGRDLGGAVLLRGQILFESERFRQAAQLFDSPAAYPPTHAVRGVLARYKACTLLHRASSRAAAGDTVVLARVGCSGRSALRPCEYEQAQ